MWVYQDAALLPVSSTELSEAGKPPEALPPKLPDAAPEALPEEPQRQEPSARPMPPRQLYRNRNCILLALSYLFGTFLAGVLSALCSTGEAAALGTYLDLWREAFAVNTAAEAIELFRMQFLTASGALAVLLLLGLSAVGSLPVFFFLMLYGTGEGLLSFQLMSGLRWNVRLLYGLASGVPSAMAAGCLCLFGAAAWKVSEELRRCSFGKKAASIGAWSLIGRFVRTAFLLLPICGAAAGMLYLCGQIKFF